MAIIKKVTQTQWSSLTVRSVIIGIIALIVLIPLSMVSGVISERSFLYQTVLDDIGSTWGRQQVLMGPILVVPYTDRIIQHETVTDKDGATQQVQKEVFYRHNAVFLPNTLDIQVALNEQFRKRGLYKSLVYTADIDVSSQFPTPNVAALSENIYKIHWNKAYLSIGLNDTRAINSVSSLNWDGAEQTLSPGTQMHNLLPQGFHAKLNNFQPNGLHQLSLKMNVNGSHSFSFAPFGETTHVSIQSSWPHPSFQGSVLPSQHNITNEGFTAEWEIPHLARNYPQSWSRYDDNFNVTGFTTGVSMFEPVSLYSQITRATKYGILFILLTFLTFLIFELTIQARLHYIQYGLIGVALSLFYLMLLSISEHLQFFTAYIASAAVTIGMISLYTLAALKSLSRTLIIFALLTTLYTILYSLLQQEDYALLMGTALLVVVVMILMFVTRNLDQQMQINEDKLD